MVPVLCKVVPLLQVDSSTVAGGGSSIARSFTSAHSHLYRPGTSPGRKCAWEQMHRQRTKANTHVPCNFAGQHTPSPCGAGYHCAQKVKIAPLSSFTSIN